MQQKERSMYILDPIIDIDKVPLGHQSETYWDEAEKKEDHTLFPEGTDPLAWRSIQGTEFNIPKDLFTHQKEDVRTVCKTDKNFLILSEMGVGKTPEAISIAMMTGAKNILVLVPKSLRLEWGRQVEQWTGTKPIICHKSS